MRSTQARLSLNNAEEGTVGLVAEYQPNKAAWTTLSYPFSMQAEGVAEANLVIIEADAMTMPQALVACRHLRTRLNKIVLFMAAPGDEETAVQAYKAGADEYIAKSIHPALLKAKLASWQRWIMPDANGSKSQKT